MCSNRMQHTRNEKNNRTRMIAQVETIPNIKDMLAHLQLTWKLMNYFIISFNLEKFQIYDAEHS